jgi:uncharacterized protein DUF3300
MRSKKSLTIVLSAIVILAVAAGSAQGSQPTTPAPVQLAQQTPEQLQQLVAPIALYPDALVAQILAASTYPAQVVEADRWMQQHSNLKGDALGQQVDQQQWDPSVKALTQFPTVLANLDKNITWTSGLGDAYTNQQQDVMNAVQVMRQRAQQAGNLSTNSQEAVSSQASTIIIQPVNPEVVYVPEYDPWIVYGAPVVAYPGWYPFAGLYIGGPGIYFGDGFGIGYFGGFGWGWHNWGFDWYDRRVVYQQNTYISHSHTFVDRHNFDHRGGDFNHGGSFGGAHAGMNHGGGVAGAGMNHGGDFHGGQVSHGLSQPHNNPGTRSSAFSGFDHGGVAHGYSMRGQSSFGGGMHGAGGGFHAGGMGGGFHGGGGGFHGGGGGGHR